MSLFIILTIITFIDAYKNKLISWILKILFQDSKISILGKEIKAMEEELSKISMIHEFAKHVKLQRRINRCKDEKKTLVKNRAFKMMKIRYVLVSTTYIIIITSLITIIWFHRSESVVKLPAKWLWPFSSFFDWSYYSPGSITVPCWIAISSSASKTFAKIL